jgi:hypothetical protein
MDTLLKCGKCLQEKPTNDFSKKTASKTGYSSICKDCHNRYSREVWYPKNNEKQKNSSAKWKENNKAKVLSTRYKIPQIEVEEVLSRSDRCEVCGKSDNLHFDHCHKSSKARGILCSGCNTALGKLGDTYEEVLDKTTKFLEYLRRI